MAKKAQTEYWVVKKTWNRRILYGPFVNSSYFDHFVNTHAAGPEARGGPVQFFLLKAIKGARVVRRAKGLVGIERQPDGNIKS